jgi:hypothetical protein
MLFVVGGVASIYVGVRLFLSRDVLAWALGGVMETIYLAARAWWLRAHVARTGSGLARPRDPLRDRAR